jgi:hypothetical protein
MRKNKNRGYQQLRVWNDAIEYYGETCRVFRGFSYELARAARQAIAASDSVHRNIAEGLPTFHPGVSQLLEYRFGVAWRIGIRASRL